MKIKIKKINPEARVPEYAHKGDAGMDLSSVEDLILGPGEKMICKTGIAMIIPVGYVGLIWDKSGISMNGGQKTLGGVIDSGYRGTVSFRFRPTEPRTL